MLVLGDGIHKMDVGIANKEDPDQKQSDLGLRCLSRLFWQAATSVQIFRTLTVVYRSMHRIYTMHNKFSNSLCIASFLCSFLCSADQFQLQ